MKRLIVEAIHSQIPRELVIRILGTSYARDPAALSLALFNWVMTVVTPLDEFEELLISPLLLIQAIETNGRTYADCDDIAMLSASLLASAGAAVRLAAVFPLPDGSFQHVLTQFRFPSWDNWRDFDPTIGYNKQAYPLEGILYVDIIS
jgi:transglutaminase-like putative cysteine protease